MAKLRTKPVGALRAPRRAVAATASRCVGPPFGHGRCNPASLEIGVAPAPAPFQALDRSHHRAPSHGARHSGRTFAPSSKPSTRRSACGRSSTRKASGRTRDASPVSPRRPPATFGASSPPAFAKPLPARSDDLRVRGDDPTRGVQPPASSDDSDQGSPVSERAPPPALGPAREGADVPQGSLGARRLRGPSRWRASGTGSERHRSRARHNQRAPAEPSGEGERPHQDARRTSPGADRARASAGPRGAARAR